jgi:hypothetical protein
MIESVVSVTTMFGPGTARFGARYRLRMSVSDPFWKEPFDTLIVNSGTAAAGNAVIPCTQLVPQTVMPPAA